MRNYKKSIRIGHMKRSPGRQFAPSPITIFSLTKLFLGECLRRSSGDGSPIRYVRCQDHQPPGSQPGAWTVGRGYTLQRGRWSVYHSSPRGRHLIHLIMLSGSNTNYYRRLNKFWRNTRRFSVRY